MSEHQIGRACFNEELGNSAPVLPSRFTLVAVVPVPLYGTQTVIVAGPGLPRWQTGMHPWMFRDLGELLTYARHPVRLSDMPSYMVPDGADVEVPA